MEVLGTTHLLIFQIIFTDVSEVLAADTHFV